MRFCLSLLKCAQGIALLCLFLAAKFQGASPLDYARRLFRNQTLASDDHRKIDSELLESRNCQVPVGRKKDLFYGKELYVDGPLRVHFYETRNGLEVPRADADYDSAVVCSGDFSVFEFDAKNWKHFLCPTSGGFATGSYKSLLADGLGAAVYCCHTAGSQKCCTREEFGQWHGKLDDSGIKTVIIVVIVVCSVLFLATVVGVSICVCCLCHCGLEICKGRRGATAAPRVGGYVVGGYAPGATGYGPGAGGNAPGAGGYAPGAGGYGPGAGGYAPGAAGYGPSGRV